MHIAESSLTEIVAKPQGEFAVYAGAFIFFEIRRRSEHIALHRVVRHALWAAAVAVMFFSLIHAWTGVRNRTLDFVAFDRAFVMLLTGGLLYLLGSIFESASEKAVQGPVTIPDWQPLEQMLGPELCSQFMYMGRSKHIHLYKHIDTRRYLNVGPDGTCFRYSSEGYVPIELDQAIEHALG